MRNYVEKGKINAYMSKIIDIAKRWKEKDRIEKENHLHQ
jgi:hypothetical protein|tara:strand:- start:85 stop:201 length:117 start_codon:yes stop_codon:yes gene_type:complete